MDPDQCLVAMHSSPGQCFRGFFLAKSRDSLDNVRTLQVRRNNSNICHELVEERWLRKKRCFHYCIHYTFLAWLLSSSSYCKPTWRRCKGISDKLAHFHQLRRCRNCSACRHGCGSSLGVDKPLAEGTYMDPIGIGLLILSFTIYWFNNSIDWPLEFFLLLIFWCPLLYMYVGLILALLHVLYMFTG